MQPSGWTFSMANLSRLCSSRMLIRFLASRAPLVHLSSRFPELCLVSAATVHLGLDPDSDTLNRISTYIWDLIINGPRPIRAKRTYCVLPKQRGCMALYADLSALNALASRGISVSGKHVHFSLPFTCYPSSDTVGPVLCLIISPGL
ncbi:hypothetical protein CONPUDRAFT_133629 [Coniophora puteana RWD-64-598 SS2]|uniref:Uncharacterized protein n=1 Tax=Coniophora puteana (strain RWD-64-598) TaxID=741705 RepID=A0A5M3N3W4_CONPW|nr:uncharacterized protein CONPUDRAFT_133629 [Coniophora puteana RWD-64-598 SS2]EIW85927.1 hypothetical protein CONPUDRAFT_133629 [Coniophora puteana RWD-64-598 SS2]